MKKINKLLISLLILVVALVIIILIGSYSPSEKYVYTDNDYGFSMTLPHDWSVQEADEAVAYAGEYEYVINFGPDNRSDFSIVVLTKKQYQSCKDNAGELCPLSPIKESGDLIYAETHHNGDVKGDPQESKIEQKEIIPSFSLKDANRTNYSTVDDIQKAKGVNPESFNYGACLYLHGDDGKIRTWTSFDSAKIESLMTVVSKSPIVKLDNSKNPYNQSDEVILGPLCTCKQYNNSRTLVSSHGLNFTSLFDHRKSALDNPGLNSCVPYSSANEYN